MSLTKLLVVIAATIALATSSRASTVNITDTTAGVYCVAGDEVKISGKHDIRDDNSVVMFANGRTLATAELLDPDGSYALTWTPSEPETMTVNIEYQSLVGDHRRVARFPISVLASAPVTWSALPPSTVQDVDLGVAIDATSDFKPASISFFCAGQPRDDQFTPPFKHTFNSSKRAAGTYVVSFTAFDANGACYVGPSQAIIVPSRIALTMTDRSKVIIGSKGQQTKFAVTIGNGYTPAKVDFELLGQSRFEAKAAPYDGTLDLNDLPDGEYYLWVRSTDATGKTYDSQSVRFELTNTPMDVAAEQQAEAEAAAAAAAAAAQAAAELKEKIAQMNAFMNAPPTVPSDPQAQAAAPTIEDALNGWQGGYKLDEIEDIKVSDSKLYPDNVEVTVKSCDGSTGDTFTDKWTLKMNIADKTISKYYTDGWGSQ